MDVENDKAHEFEARRRGILSFRECGAKNLHEFFYWSRRAPRHVRPARLRARCGSRPLPGRAVLKKRVWFHAFTPQ